MSKRTLTAIALAVVFTLALAAPVFGSNMTYTSDFNLDGTISADINIGHFCNTGAEMKQDIAGAGKMSKQLDFEMEENFLDVDDNNDWIAAATSSLSVQTAIKLCAPAKHLYDVPSDFRVGDYYDDPESLIPGWESEYILNWFEEGNYPDTSYLLRALDEQVVDLETLYALLIAGLEGPITDPLTEQIWAVRVSADPGYSGQVNTSFKAANGGFEGWLDEDESPDDDLWAFDADGKVVRGKDFIGNYFEIDQFARTSQGTTQRYIDISSPFSHAYLHEEMTVVGMAEVTDSFMMDNIKPGAEAPKKWWDVF